MVEPTSQQLQLTHVLVMATLWLHVPDYPFRLIFWTKPDCFDYFTVCFDVLTILLQFVLQDLEFVQFHPTGIYGTGCLITEGFVIVHISFLFGHISHAYRFCLCVTCILNPILKFLWHQSFFVQVHGVKVAF